jgi:ABC-type transport system substrate-binding protein
MINWIISFTLRPNAVFSDGTQITPDIVAENFNRWFDPKSPLRGSGDYATWGRIFLGFLGEKGDRMIAQNPQWMEFKRWMSIPY